MYAKKKKKEEEEGEGEEGEEGEDKRREEERSFPLFKKIKFSKHHCPPALPIIILT